MKQRLLELKEEYGDQDDKYPELMKLRNQLWSK